VSGGGAHNADWLLASSVGQRPRKVKSSPARMANKLRRQGRSAGGAAPRDREYPTTRGGCQCAQVWSRNRVRAPAGAGQDLSGLVGPTAVAAPAQARPAAGAWFATVRAPARQLLSLATDARAPPSGRRVVAAPAHRPKRPGVDRRLPFGANRSCPMALRGPSCLYAVESRGRISVFGVPRSWSAGFQPAGWAGFQPARSLAGGLDVSASGHPRVGQRPAGPRSTLAGRLEVGQPAGWNPALRGWPPPAGHPQVPSKKLRCARVATRAGCQLDKAPWLREASSHSVPR
jgi:hypothetical protein